jgi:hypothetical protein
VSGAATPYDQLVKELVARGSVHPRQWPRRPTRPLGSSVGVIFCALAHLSTSGPFRAGPIGDCRSRNVMRPLGSPYVHDPSWCNPAVGDRPRGQRSAGFRSPAWAATPPRSTTLLVWTKGSSLGAGLPWPARDTSFCPIRKPRAPRILECPRFRGHLRALVEKTRVRR